MTGSHRLLSVGILGAAQAGLAISINLITAAATPVCSVTESRR